MRKFEIYFGRGYILVSDDRTMKNALWHNRRNTPMKSVLLGKIELDSVFGHNARSNYDELNIKEVKQ